MLNTISKLVGCTALVVTVAVVFYVAITQLDKEGPKIDPSYLEQSSESQAEHRWSGSEPQPRDSRLNLTRPLRPSAITEPPKPDRFPPPPEGAQIPSRASTQPLKATPGIAEIEAKRPQIEAVVRKFFTAGTLSEKAASSRDSARVQPLMEVYYQKNPLTSGQWRGIGWVMPMEEPGHNLAYVQTLFNGSDPICVIIEESKDGRFLVDWESSVRYSEIDWKDFISTRPDHPTLFRVIASKPTDFIDAQTDRTQEVIELKHPAEQGTVYAYFNRDDPQFRSLLEQLKLGNWANVPLTLRLCYPGPTASSRSVRITSIEGKGWIILQHRRS